MPQVSEQFKVTSAGANPPLEYTSAGLQFPTLLVRSLGGTRHVVDKGYDKLEPPIVTLDDVNEQSGSRFEFNVSASRVSMDYTMSGGFVVVKPYMRFEFYSDVQGTQLLHSVDKEDVVDKPSSGTVAYEAPEGAKIRSVVVRKLLSGGTLGVNNFNMTV